MIGNGRRASITPSLNGYISESICMRQSKRKRSRQMKFMHVDAFRCMFTPSPIIMQHTFRVCVCALALLLTLLLLYMLCDQCLKLALCYFYQINARHYYCTKDSLIPSICSVVLWLFDSLCCVLTEFVQYGHRLETMKINIIFHKNSR